MHWDDMPDRNLDEIENDRQQFDDEFEDTMTVERDEYLDRLEQRCQDAQRQDEEEMRRSRAIELEEEYLNFLENSPLMNEAHIINNHLVVLPKSVLEKDIFKFFLDRFNIVI